MSENELKSYREKYIAQFGDPIIIKKPTNFKVINPAETSNRRAWNNISWIDYWRALTECYEETLNCVCCGCLIFENSSSSCLDVSPCETMKALGGHIYFNEEDESYSGYYIAPMCPKCNSNDNRYIELNDDVELCAEIGTTDK